MPRLASDPPLPTDLGSWLACFRHRLRNPDGHPHSPEQLGLELGVSGATVRRWEVGAGKPSSRDLVNLARVARLSPLQLSFLSRALAANDIVVVPDGQGFRRRVRSLLCTPYPAFLFDDLFYCRAWNSHVFALNREVTTINGGRQLLENLFDVPATFDMTSSRLAARRRALRDFWLLTATRCGQRQYKELIKHLAHLPSFADLWINLALGDDLDELGPLGAPFDFIRTDTGNFRTYPLTVVLPPQYHLREYVPTDAGARESLATLTDKGPPEVFFDRKVHWAEK